MRSWPACPAFKCYFSEACSLCKGLENMFHFDACPHFGCLFWEGCIFCRFLRRYEQLIKYLYLSSCLQKENIQRPLFIMSSWWPGHPVIICPHIVCLAWCILTLVAFVGLHDDEVMTRVSSLTAQFILLGTFIGGEGGVLDVLRAKVQNLPILILISSSSFSAIFSGVR